MPSDKSWEVSKIKATKWLMDSKARDSNGIDDWNITTPAIVKKKRRNSAERPCGSRIEKVLSRFPFFFMCDTWCRSNFLCFYVALFWFVFLFVIDF